MREFRVGHDGRGIRIDQHDLIALRAQRLACLRTGVIKLASLADDDRARPDNQNLFYVFSLWQVPRSPIVSCYYGATSALPSTACSPLDPVAAHHALHLVAMIQQRRVNRLVMVALLPFDHFARAFEADEVFHGLPFQHANRDVKIAAAKLAVAFRSPGLQVRKSSLEVFGQSWIFGAMPFHQNPMSLFVNISRKRQVIIVEEAQVQSQHGIGMIHRPALDRDVTRNGVLLQVVLPGEALHLLLALFLHRKAMPGLDVQLGSLGSRSRRYQRHRGNDQDRLNVFVLGHGAIWNPSGLGPSSSAPPADLQDLSHLVICTVSRDFDDTVAGPEPRSLDDDCIAVWIQRNRKSPLLVCPDFHYRAMRI